MMHQNNGQPMFLADRVLAEKHSKNEGPSGYKLVFFGIMSPIALWFLLDIICLHFYGTGWPGFIGLIGMLK